MIHICVSPAADNSGLAGGPVSHTGRLLVNSPALETCDLCRENADADANGRVGS